jgi:transposase-like protein
MNLSIDLHFEFERYRCYECGSIWAMETGRVIQNMSCPRCARESIKQARDQRDASIRTANSLRGQITKLKKKK